MMKNLFQLTLATLLTITSTVSMSADFDGSKPLICAPVEAIDCGVGVGCTKGVPDDIGAPNFMRIDFKKKVIVGPKRTTAILFMDKTKEQLLLQGTELGFAWTFALDAQGKMTATLADRAGAFIMFGSCTPL